MNRWPDFISYITWRPLGFKKMVTIIWGSFGTFLAVSGGFSPSGSQMIPPGVMEKIHWRIFVFVFNRKKWYYKKHLDTVVVCPKTFFIFGRCYLFSLIEDIIKDPCVNGILLNTTWHVLTNDMTSIPTLSFQNVGFSVEFQFGLSEDETIYSDFFTHF